VVETHISWVLLAGDYAYKLKKPVDFGFLDFSTLAARRHFCEEELRLNRRLAPRLYLELVAISSARRGRSSPPASPISISSPGCARRTHWAHGSIVCAPGLSASTSACRRGSRSGARRAACASATGIFTWRTWC
jgi:hypothetical protein